jgi:hypothetical protein
MSEGLPNMEKKAGIESLGIESKKVLLELYWKDPVTQESMNNAMQSTTFKIPVELKLYFLERQDMSDLVQKEFDVFKQTLEKKVKRDNTVQRMKKYAIPVLGALIFAAGGVAHKVNQDQVAAQAQAKYEYENTPADFGVESETMRSIIITAQQNAEILEKLPQDDKKLIFDILKIQGLLHQKAAVDKIIKNPDLDWKGKLSIINSEESDSKN